MATQADRVKDNDGRMERKPILMPPSLIGYVDALAGKASKEENRNVSFAEIVRRALISYEPKGNKEDEEMVEAILDSLNASIKDTVKDLKKLNKKLAKYD